jgi:hypothetical protein
MQMQWRILKQFGNQIIHSFLRNHALKVPITFFKDRLLSKARSCTELCKLKEELLYILKQIAEYMLEGMDARVLLLSAGSHS